MNVGRRLLVGVVTIGMLTLVLGCNDAAPDRHDSSSPEDEQMSRIPLDWEVAPGRHPASDSLGEISGVARDASGNIYATDRLAGMIWVIDAEGTLLLGFGGKGEGPGEFEAPTGPAVGPDGRLYVRDVYRVSVFGPDAATGLLTEHEETFPGPVYADWMSTRATRFDTTGAMLYPGSRWLEGGTAVPYVLRYDHDRVLTDTIFAPTYPTTPQLTAFVQTSPGGGRMLPGLNHVPFAPIPAWDVTPEGNVISGDALSYDLTESTPEQTTVATYRRDLPPVPIPAEERGDSLEALRSRRDSIPVSWDDVVGMPEEVRSLALPTVYPAYMAIYTGNDSRVWVRRWPVGGGDRTVFDVFDRTGRFMRTVELPRDILVEPTPYLSESVVIGVSVSPLTGESRIHRFAPDGTE